MRLAPVLLVVADISGYTHFIRYRVTTLLHAEAIVTELIETVLDRLDSPLVLNKLEGDAALLYAELDGDPATVPTLVDRVETIFEAFDARVAELVESRRACGCGACANVGALKLKAFVHVGEAVIKPVRQFQELAGEDVILIHRLMKNSVPANDYLLLTDAAERAAGGRRAGFVAHRETAEGIGDVDVAWRRMA
jgi:hypothetical protein